MDIKKIIDNFSKVKIGVVGDVMLDRYIYGSVERISPEAPVPVIKKEKEVYCPGGAANVAANISFLGGEPFLFGYIGKDKSGEILISELEKNKIKNCLFSTLSNTIEKTRIIGDNPHQFKQQILRIDYEEHARATKETERSFLEQISRNELDIIIFSDYNKGCLSENLCKEIIRDYPQKVIVDPKPNNKRNYSEAYLITPNLKEAKEMSGLIDVDEIGRKLQKDLKCNVLITQGREGMTLFHGKSIFNVPAQAKEVYDVTGAGDTVVSVLGLCLGSLCDLEDSVYIANHAAGIVVGKAGAASVSKNELAGIVDKEFSKIMNMDELKLVRRDYKRKGKKVVWTNGCFDILHPGHVDYLKKARKLGDYLIVGLNSDNSAIKLKGKGRPVHNQNHRAEVLSSLECVDSVLIFDGLDSVSCLEELKPDVYVKGGDYNLNKINQNEKGIIECYGGKIEFIPMIHQISTSQIINQIRNGN